jgi:phosphatidylinositol phospholipase C, delta
LLLRAGGGGGPTEQAALFSAKEFERDGASERHLKNIYDQHVKDRTFQDGTSLTDQVSFMQYMRSPAAAALGPRPDVDLSHPMSSYYISSSHNTYLTGNQLYGDANTDGYTNVLKRGCRCLEIDIWDGDDSDTSASSSDEEGDHPRTTTTPKKSRWSRMKTKAAHIRGTSPAKGREAHASPGRVEGATSAHLEPTGSVGPPVPFKAEPQVVHGWTLTQAIPFRTVCAAIRESAFVATDLPLIVSLETHANLEQQQTMVEIMKEAWGDYLVDMGDATKMGFDQLPSPDSFRNKILIKVKWASGHTLGDASGALENVQTNTTESSEGGTPNKKPSKMLPALSEMGMFTRAFSFKSWDQPEASIPTHTFSLTDSKAQGLHVDPLNGPAMFRHNKNYLTRIYPRGTRIRSSNYDPTFHWRDGAQMVALNWQRLDQGMMLNEGMFAGYEGWVLKPDGYLRDEKDTTEITATLKSGAQISHSVPTRRLVELKVQVFSAQSIPVPHERDPSHASKLKPYVQFELHVDTHGPPGLGKSGEQSNADADSEEDASKERERHKRRSKTQRHDSPDFDGECFSWTGIDVVEKLSFLR